MDASISDPKHSLHAVCVVGSYSMHRHTAQVVLTMGQMPILSCSAASCVEILPLECLYTAPAQVQSHAAAAAGAATHLPAWPLTPEPMQRKVCTCCHIIEKSLSNAVGLDKVPSKQ
jgi:hypothetical protein